MKKLLLGLMLAGTSVPAMAQTATPRIHRDSLLSRWVFDVNLLGGLASQTYTTANSAANYPNVLNANTGNLTYNNGYSFGADAQLGFFFGKKRHFGIGAGIMYMEQHGDATLDNFHVEYQATDGSGNIFRQVVNGNDIKENIITRSVGVPIMLKYKDRFSKHWGFAVDAGAIINIQTMNNYTTHANFDYEAIYKFAQTDAGQVSVYDNSPTPQAGDWLITKAEFYKNNPNGNLADYFAAKRALGYSVGDGISPTSTTGSNTSTTVNVGFMIKPSFQYFLSDHVALDMGLYYMIQPYTNNAQSGYRLTDGIGHYNSVLNNVSSGTDQAYGVNLGVRFFFGRGHSRLVITSVDQTSPTQCGQCDGSLAFHGLIPGKDVKVNYSLNGIQQTEQLTRVQDDGKANIIGLCSGTYTNIVATIKKRSATTEAIVLTDPIMPIAQIATNPTVSGTCNGTLSFTGLYAGKMVTVSYDVDGRPQAPFTGICKADNSIRLVGLCPGNYTNIVLKISKCVANGNDLTLVAPAPVVIPEVTTPAKTEIDISEPILFDVNMSVIHKEYYPEIDEAAEQMKQNKNMHLIIEGNTDASGTMTGNNVLSVQRANSVKTQLTKRGVNAGRVHVKGYGSSRPAATNETKAGKKENRRAIMKIIPAQ